MTCFSGHGSSSQDASCCGIHKRVIKQESLEYQERINILTGSPIIVCSMRNVY